MCESECVRMSMCVYMYEWVYVAYDMCADKYVSIWYINMCVCVCLCVLIQSRYVKNA